jgi:hypothetical protein
MFDYLLDQYRSHIVEAGKQPLFLLLVGFIMSFAFIRFSVRMIRRGVSWWPGNIKPGGLHIHHIVFGMGFLLVGGVAEFSTLGQAAGWRDLFAFLFGVGCGLVLDEFALILHLEDVYWSEQGRKSVDAVIIGMLIVALLLVGGLPLGLPSGGGRWAAAGILAATALLSLITLLKGKVWTGLMGLMIPVLALVGALRLARPDSPWARWRYAGRPKRAERARRRDNRLHRRIERARFWLFDLIAGAPETAPVLQKYPNIQKATDRLAQAVAPHAPPPLSLIPPGDGTPPAPAAARQPLSEEELQHLLALRRRVVSLRRKSRRRVVSTPTHQAVLARLGQLREELREEHQESHELRRRARRQARTRRRSR